MGEHRKIGLQHESLTDQVLGAFYEVYRELGFGFLESVYEAALTMALEDRGLRVARQVDILVSFPSRVIGKFRADLLVEDRVLLELKAARTLESAHEAQLLNALKASAIEVGLLLNFGPSPQFKRMVFSSNRKDVSVHPRSSVAPTE